nr:hypothetical protein Hi04_10k_c4997_00012 [uncultured bacterium]
MRNRTEPAARNIILTRDHIDTRITEMTQIDPALGLFARVPSIAGTRAGSLARRRRDDLGPGDFAIPRSAKGRPGLPKHTSSVMSAIPVRLAGEIIAQTDQGSGLLFYARRNMQELGRLSTLDDVLLRSGAIGRVWCEAGRTAWSKNQWARPVREAVQRAGLPGNVSSICSDIPVPSK